jgi:hypothetical protein
VLNPPLHSIDDCKRDKECEVIGERIPWRILENLLVDVADKVERRQMN